MAVALVLTVLGGLARLGGLAIMFCGALRTWRELNPETRLLDLIRSRADRFMLQVSNLVRRILKRLPRAHQVHDRAGGAFGIGVRGDVRARRGYGSLDPNLDLPKAIAELGGASMQPPNTADVGT